MTVLIQLGNTTVDSSTVAPPVDRLVRAAWKLEGDVIVIDAAIAASITAQKSIMILEASVTPSRQREATTDSAGGSAAGRTWLADISSQIAVLRSQV